jgi:protein-disulfide isomerase/uncharacterized membrane protein
MAAALMLALDHFALTTLPGCGPQSGCDRATRSAWGTIPGINWPVSLLGVAYFAAMLAAWLTTSRGVHPLLRLLAWLGAAGSVLFIAVMAGHGYLCKYCLATHVANMIFLVVMEVAARTSGMTDRPAPLAAGAMTFVAVTLGLAVIHVQTGAKRLAKAEAARLASLAQMQHPATRSDSPNSATTTTVTGTATAPIGNAKPFTGRWRLGPENAPIRIVMFMDYQCHDCQEMESQVAALLQRRSDVSVSVKHFPMCADCNSHIGGVRMHPNACWAARAAEAAGMLRGNDGFWQMHNWLFQHGGAFTDEDLPPSLAQMGYDPQQFIQTMSSSETLSRVLADVDEGNDVGLFFTPMIFINGVELRGFIGNPGALTRTVDDLAATHPPPGSPAQDQPPRAAAKYVDDWAGEQARNIVNAPRTWAIGPADAKVQIVMWSDYQQPLTAELDKAIRDVIAAGHSVRYIFRHYPFDKSCNPNVPDTMHPWGCTASRAAEAAGVLGGNDGYWKMHDFLLAHQTGLNEDLLRSAAAAAGVDFAAFSAKMSDPDVQGAVVQDAQAGQQYYRQGIPIVYINGRWVARWKLDGDKILERIAERIEAGK